MEIQKETWLPFHPNESYTRRYNNHFYSQISEHISGRVLDIGAQQSNEEEYRKLSDDLDEYISLDITRSESIDMLADGRNLPLKSDSIDTVVLSAVLEHVPIQGVPDLLDEAKRVLTAGGVVIAYVAFVYPLHAAPHDYYRPTYYGLDSLFSDCGFDTEIFAGGGLGETLLHSAFVPVTIGTNFLNMDALRWLFFIPHIMTMALSITFGKLIKLMGDEKILEKWYIGQLVVGTVD